jgi:uncharacterized protein (DUF433 family)
MKPVAPIAITRIRAPDHPILRRTIRSSQTGCKRDPLKLHGAPNINGLRITPDTIVGNFEAGLDIAEIHEQFPGVPVVDIRTVLNHAA